MEWFEYNVAAASRVMHAVWSITGWSLEDFRQICNISLSKSRLQRLLVAEQIWDPSSLAVPAAALASEYAMTAEHFWRAVGVGESIVEIQPLDWGLGLFGGFVRATSASWLHIAEKMAHGEKTQRIRIYSRHFPFEFLNAGARNAAIGSWSRTFRQGSSQDYVRDVWQTVFGELHRRRRSKARNVIELVIPESALCQMYLKQWPFGRCTHEMIDESIEEFIDHEVLENRVELLIYKDWPFGQGHTSTLYPENSFSLLSNTERFSYGDRRQAVLQMKGYSGITEVIANEPWQFEEPLFDSFDRAFQSVNGRAVIDPSSPLMAEYLRTYLSYSLNHDRKIIRAESLDHYKQCCVAFRPSDSNWSYGGLPSSR